MRRTLTVLVLALTGFVGCSSDTATDPNIDSLFPASAEVSGYAIDANAADRKTAGSTAVEVYTSFDSATGAVDGDTAPFQTTMSEMARQFYAKGNSKVMVRIWKLKDAATAKNTFDNTMFSDSHYFGDTWVDDSGVGEESKIANIGIFYKLEALKTRYILEGRISKVSGKTTEDPTAKADVEAMLKAVVGKIQ
jgi:hypothetical protein